MSVTAYAENIDIFVKCLDIKKYREFIISEYLDSSEALSQFIISKYKLNRVANKYITKKRLYDDNSYNKRKMREEELMFIDIIHRAQGDIQQLLSQRELEYALEISGTKFSLESEQIYQQLYKQSSKRGDYVS